MKTRVFFIKETGPKKRSILSEGGMMAKRSTDMVHIQVLVPHETRTSLIKLAYSKGYTMSSYIRMLIKKDVEEKCRK